VVHAGALPGAEWKPGAGNPIAVRLVHEMNTRAMSGLVSACGHLCDSPGVVWWIPWSPDLMRCASCASDVLLATRGTREDNRCDGCGRVVDRIRTGVLQAGAVVIILGLCNDCESER